MKTLVEYEANDIKLTKEELGDEPVDAVHSFLMAECLIIGIIGFRPRPEDPDTNAGKLLPVKRLIAQVLNDAQKQGITIAKREDVPAVFRQS